MNKKNFYNSADSVKQCGSAPVPEGFTLGMAILDFIPVIFFIISSFVIAMRFESVLFRIGVFFVILAGILKVLWKFIIVLAHKNIRFFNRQMRYLMPTGFLLAFIALFVDKNRWSFPSVLHFIITPPSLIFFIAGACGIATLAWYARHLNGNDAKANWKEQAINSATQFLIMLGILL
ncbi:MAG: hypothetical protein DUD27_06315 [Lachnospiraceae bacterium]|uniref:Uncharacterized protein n=1 Tax=Candidatus Weimeria bifida TaxID=2599074 RepID=A0A6N7IXW1_9FIRM|nr:hypothetical protein [Candidatus Weimeria bifida]RRF96139.1 MAG: hypothetical protein DUD27_06315 [Lachnospiraceae bacterium]